MHMSILPLASEAPPNQRREMLQQLGARRLAGPEKHPLQ
jgi:hypothetical protein